MIGTLKRLIVAASAIASLSTALVLSGPAQSNPVRTVGSTDEVQMDRTNISPADLGASIRGQGT